MKTPKLGSGAAEELDVRQLDAADEWEKRRIHLIVPKELLDRARTAANAKCQTFTEYTKTALQTLMVIDDLQDEGIHIFASKSVVTPVDADTPVIEILRDRFLMKKK